MTASSVSLETANMTVDERGRGEGGAEEERKSRLKYKRGEERSLATAVCLLYPRLVPGSSSLRPSSGYDPAPVWPDELLLTLAA